MVEFGPEPFDALGGDEDVRVVQVLDDERSPQAVGRCADGFEG